MRSAWIVGLLSVSIGAACNAATVSPSAAVEAPPSTPAIHEERDVAAPRPSPPSAGTVTSDRPPARVELPGAGGFRFEITTAAEYALYVRAAGGSASISLHRDETLLEQVYSVDGVNTDRFLRFLTPGTYALRLTERQARPLQVTAELRQLEPLPSAGSITLGRPLTVVFSSDDLWRGAPSDGRAGMRALTLTIPTAGHYRCSVRPRPGPRSLRAHVFLELVSSGSLLAAERQRSDDASVAVTAALEPGTYTVRLRPADTYHSFRASVLCARWRGRAPSVPDDGGDLSGTTPSSAPPSAPRAPHVPLAVGRGPARLDVPAGPGIDVEVTTAGEYEIVVIPSRGAPEVFLPQPGELVMAHRIDDGMRLVRFLTPGAHPLRFLERHGGPITATVEVRILPPRAPDGVLTLGVPLRLELPADVVPMGDQRAGARSATLVAPEAGRYTCALEHRPIPCCSGRIEPSPVLQIVAGGRIIAAGARVPADMRRSVSVSTELPAGTYEVRVFDGAYTHEALLVELTCSRR